MCMCQKQREREARGKEREIEGERREKDRDRAREGERESETARKIDRSKVFALSITHLREKDTSGCYVVCLFLLLTNQQPLTA